MTKFRAIILGMVLAVPTLLHSEDTPKPDVVSQRVLSKYGVDSRILRSFDQLQELSSRKDGRFFLNFEGRPGFQVSLDRDYWVLATWNAKKEYDLLGYMLNAGDPQSALVISVGNDVHGRPDADLKKDPEFSEITFGDGVVNGQKVKWRRWSDQNHLCSDCTLLLAVRDKTDAPQHKVNISITANTKERRSALEDSMASLQLQYARQ